MKKELGDTFYPDTDEGFDWIDMLVVIAAMLIIYRILF